MKLYRKGGDYMTDVLVGLESFVNFCTKEQPENNHTKLDTIIVFLQCKKALKSPTVQRLISDYIVKDKKIRIGKSIIKGTRLTPDDITELFITKKMEISDIKNEYPSITSDKQVLAALAYSFEKELSLMFFIRVLFKNDFLT